jgi:hypothetical protein
MAIADFTDIFESTTERADLLRESLAELEALRGEVENRIKAISDFLRQIDGPPEYPRKREAVLSYFDEAGDRPVTLAEIRTALIERRQIAPTRKAAHALQMTLTTLYKEGLLERLRNGVYVLPQKMGESQLAAFNAYSGSLPAHHAPKGEL